MLRPKSRSTAPREEDRPLVRRAAYSAHFPEQPNNRSHVADKAYYVYLPNIPQYISHQPYVKGFRHQDGYGLGLRLMYTWLDR